MLCCQEVQSFRQHTHQSFLLRMTVWMNWTKKQSCGGRK
ncbi:hypothetical protein ID866_8750 [Astraeus odoratus]|nr:hypothetical protein ID866_8750 [Astraeus odoratus]